MDRPWCAVRVARRSRFAFTLVELLVVIGIIALLISILLPVLGSVRRQAQAVKCSASMREIGNAFQMYAMENRQYFPPLRINSAGYTISFTKTIPPVNFTSGTQQIYWMYFLAKYVTNGKMAPVAGATARDAAYAMRSVLWGCPSFTPIQVAPGDSRAAAGDTVAMVYTGYGYNAFADYTPTFPAIAPGQPQCIGDTINPRMVSTIGTPTPAGNWSNYQSGTWYKQKDYTTPAERALIADARAYVLEAAQCMGVNSIIGQADLNSPGSVFWVNGGPSEGESSYDFYRHGTYPKRMGTNQFSPTGGKVAFNVLFADGHVSTLVQRDGAFRASRMRFPG